MMDVQIGQVFVSKSGKRFAVAQVDREGVWFWSIAANVMLDAAYSAARLQQHVDGGALSLTGETFDVEAAERPRIEREAAVREERARLAQDAAIAGARQLDRMAGPGPAGSGALNEPPPRRR